MSANADAELVAPCGLYCGGCPIFRASSDSTLAQRIAQNIGLPPEQVKCLGCRAEKGHIRIMGGPVCPTYQCVEEKGVRFCYQCEEFPCLKLAPCADKAQLLPHNTKIYNLVLLQRLGLEEWLRGAPHLWRQYFSGKKEHGGDELKV